MPINLLGKIPWSLFTGLPEAYARGYQLNLEAARLAQQAQLEQARLEAQMAEQQFQNNLALAETAIRAAAQREEAGLRNAQIQADIERQLLTTQKIADEMARQSSIAARYNELIEMGTDPIEAAYQATMEFGDVSAARFASPLVRSRLPRQQQPSYEPPSAMPGIYSTGLPGTFAIVTPGAKTPHYVNVEWPGESELRATEETLRRRGIWPSAPNAATTARQMGPEIEALVNRYVELMREREKWLGQYPSLFSAYTTQTNVAPDLTNQVGNAIAYIIQRE